MATVKETPYQAWEFSEEEWPVAAVFSDLQEKHIRTELAACASEKVMLAVNPEFGQEVYLREQEYIRGKMEVLTYLLIVSEETKNGLQQALAKQTASQKSDSQPAKPQPT